MQHYAEAAARNPATGTKHPTKYQVQVSTDQASDASAYSPTGRVATGHLATEPTKLTPYEIEAAA